MILGIDIGTQSLKAVIADQDLLVCGWGSIAYQPSYPKPGWAEQDPRLWEQALGPAIAAALEEAGAEPADVAALAISGQLDGCLPVDEQGVALGPALIWLDRRASDEIAAIDPMPVQEKGGVVLDASHMAAKIRWLERHGPKDIAGFHQPVSYLTERLTGEAVMDHGLASTTMLYALAKRDYDPDLLDLFEISRDKLPRLADASTLAGRLNSQGAAMTGLQPGTAVAVGTGDDFTGPLGAGLAAPGRLACTLGTAEVVGALHPDPLIDPDSLVETHAFPGDLYYLENPGWLSGGAVTWFCQAHGLSDPAELDRLAEQTLPGAEGLCFFPALSGAMAPEWHAGARAAYYGLTPAHGREHMARTVLESCAFAMRDVNDRLKTVGLSIDALLLSGGGARSRIWTQIRADLTALPAQRPKHLDTSPLGAALLAAAATGLVDDLAAAGPRINPVAETVEPDSTNKAAYDEAYGRYRDLFATLKPLFDGWTI